jgi:hypothetical protein
MAILNTLARIPRSRTTIALAMLALALVAIAPPALAQDTVGTVSQVSGVVTVQRAGATIAAAPHLPILVHDRISTSDNASVTIDLVDKSSLQLGENGALRIDEGMMVNGVGAPSKVTLLGGKLHSVIVGAMKNSSPQFQVLTPNVGAAPHG